MKIFKLYLLRCNISKINKGAIYKKKYWQHIYLPKKLYLGSKKNSQFNNYLIKREIKKLNKCFIEEVVCTDRQ